MISTIQKKLLIMTLQQRQAAPSVSSSSSSSSAMIWLLFSFILLILEQPSTCQAFSVVHPTTCTARITDTQLAAYSSEERRSSRSSSSSRPYSNNFNNVRSKRQERVGHLVRTELSRILHAGNIRGNVESIDAELRQRISIVSADVSPDLRQARISVSIRATAPKRRVSAVALKEENDDDDTNVDSDSATTTTTTFVNSNNNNNNNNPAVDKRRAYSWLVRNNKAIRYSLAQRMNHIKSSCPQLSFVQVDVGAAVDVMQLIDQVTSNSNKKRETIAVNMQGDDNDDNEFSGDDWINDDDDFF